MEFALLPVVQELVASGEAAYFFEHSTKCQVLREIGDGHVGDERERA